LGEHVNTLIGHTQAVTYLDLFNIYTLISVSWDKTIKLWNISNGSLLQTINTEIQINALTMLKTSKIFNFSGITNFS
jgi:WD40 repeat protein